MEEELKKHLLKMADEKGICNDGHNKVANSDMTALIEYYISNPDWCMERDFPSLKMLREDFSDLEQHGIYIDKHFDGELLDARQIYIFHHCTGWIKTGLNVEKAIIPMFYFANQCRMRVKSAMDKSRWLNVIKVPLYMFGANDISAKDAGGIKYLKFKNSLI